MFSRLFSKQIEAARKEGYDECNRSRQVQVDRLIEKLQQTEELLRRAVERSNGKIFDRLFLRAVGDAAVDYTDHADAEKFADDTFSIISNYWYAEEERAAHKLAQSDKEKLEESVRQSADFARSQAGRLA